MVDSSDDNIPVSTVMSGNYVVLPDGTDLSRIAKVFADKSPICVLITNGEDVLGVLTKKRLLKTVGVEDLEDLPKVPTAVKKLDVRKFMAKPVAIFENEPINHAIEKMTANNVSVLIVLDIKNKLIGVLSKKDLLISRVKTRVGPSLETSIDKLLHIIEKVESIDIEKVSKELNVSQQLVEEWGEILEEHGLIEVDYPAFGKPLFKLAKKVSKEE